jgi:glycosyltransferase involved in cell wall biosynthesis
VAEHLLKQLPGNIPKGRIQIIPCGVDFDLFRPTERKLCCDQLGWPQETFHVLFQDTGDPVKRPELAKAAVEQLEKLGVKVDLRYLRGVAYDQVSIWLNASDVLLVTSYHEGSPTIVKEALACNLPIVSVPVGDIPQRIQKIEGCYLSDPDALTLALNLQKVWDSRGRVKARETIHDVSAERCAQVVKGLYERVLKSVSLPSS